MGAPVSPELLGRHDAKAVEAARAMSSGRFGLALELFEEAMALAGELQDLRKVHAARLNISGCYLGLGDWSRARTGLAEIILQTELPRHAAKAAVQLAEALLKEGKSSKAAQYLRIGVDHARLAGDQDGEMAALSMQGLLDLVEGRHAAAVERYAAALAIAERNESPSRAWILDQLGYAQVVAGRTAEGLRNLRRGLTAARRTGNRWLQAEVHVDLAFGFLLGEKNRAAERHALVGLALAEEVKDHPAVMKNATFILMELSLRGDREQDFDRWFRRLQQLMPDVKLSRDFFRIFDISDVINLKEL